MVIQKLEKKRWEALSFWCEMYPRYTRLSGSYYDEKECPKPHKRGREDYFAARARSFRHRPN